ncbi:MAG: helix-turn-helix transcriptional regulator [Chloroflexi bacterium]|nr:helix-turn-helix transcriptional regulator [Chloroflexota bacterium]
MDFQLMCPRYEKAIQTLARRWTPLILRALMERPRRFTEIRNYVDGLSDRLLSQRLRELEEAGIVQRKVYPQRPVVIEYSLTEKGAELRQVIEAVQIWAEHWVALEEMDLSPSAG